MVVSTGSLRLHDSYMKSKTGPQEGKVTVNQTTSHSLGLTFQE